MGMPVGSWELRAAQDTRQIVSFSKVVVLPAGTHAVGLCGISPTNAAAWNSNEWGNVNAIVL